MNNVTWDWPLFEVLNFDGPVWLDGVMTAVSGTTMWVPLYLLIIYMVWRRYSWRGLAVFLVAMGVAIGMADVVAAIFKHQGPLGNLLPSFPARLRPMHTPVGLDVCANGYFTGNLYGTVSGHTSTIVAITLLSTYAVGRKWFSFVMPMVAVLICYSRIYLACHFPQDILLGAVLGVASGVCGILLFRWLQQLLARNKKS